MAPNPNLIEVILASDRKTWDDYVLGHPSGAFTHLWPVAEAIKKAYGHDVYLLMAMQASGAVDRFAAPPEGLHPGGAPGPDAAGVIPCRIGRQRPVGILPLVHIRHLLLGNSLVSMPFFDFGGMVCDDESVEAALLDEARRIGIRLGARYIEIRHRSLLLEGPSEPKAEDRAPNSIIRSHRVRMVLQLPESSQELMKSFKSKLRSQITKAMREGLTLKIGGEDLLDDFYHVFAENMRDLGSPVHAKGFIAAFLHGLPEEGRVFTVVKDNRTLAASIAFAFKDTVVNPWASSLRAFSRLNPNMLLYWGMLEFACNNGFRTFDFGRSTPGEGTYRFKEQWGAKPVTSPWQLIALNGRAPEDHGSIAEGKSFRFAGEVWQRLPVGLTRTLGPHIRKYISL
jgi:FemAB-related protein (PEP-CTERM system-associated)